MLKVGSFTHPQPPRSTAQFGHGGSWVWAAGEMCGHWDGAAIPTSGAQPSAKAVQSFCGPGERS